MPTYYGKADIHMHTTASDGVSTVREVLDYIASYTDLDVIAITDHDRVDAANWALEHQDEYPFEIIPGVEISSRIGHILGLWVEKPIAKDMNLDDTVAAIHEQGGLAILAHPYHIHMCVVTKSFLRYTLQPDVLLQAGLDGIEIHNAGFVLPGMNALAKRLANRVGIACTGSSDAHTLGGIGSGITRFPGRSAAALRQAIAQAQTYAEGATWPLIDYWIYSRNSTHNKSNEFLAENLPSSHLTHPSNSRR